LKNASAVRLREDCFFQGPADLSSVDIESRDELHIAAKITPDRLAHDSVDRRARAIPVVFYTLHQRTGAIADPGNGHLDIFAHAENPRRVILVGHQANDKSRRRVTR
jgi:hypothetical protein